jgi:hypothetical protein
VGGEAPVTPVSSPDSSPWTFPTNRAITWPTDNDSVENPVESFSEDPNSSVCVRGIYLFESIKNFETL